MATTDATAEILNKLRIMYPGYKFEMKFSAQRKVYQLTSYKNGKNLSTLTLEPTTPMNIIWESIKLWMRPLLSY